jgi:hypothetical protein
VRRNEPVVLWSPEAGVPAINGVVTVESWSHLSKSAEHWIGGAPINTVNGWTCKVRVLDMRITEVIQ